LIVIPAQAGIQSHARDAASGRCVRKVFAATLDSRLRGNDGEKGISLPEPPPSCL
jgi:hypothetical protein